MDVHTEVHNKGTLYLLVGKTNIHTLYGTTGGYMLMKPSIDTYTFQQLFSDYVPISSSLGIVSNITNLQELSINYNFLSQAT